ncbi:MAG: B12-binding domain-containing protein [Anaerofustis sp.]
MQKISELLSNLDEDELMKEVKAQLSDGISPEEILKECQDGMVSVGERFGAGEYFVSDLMMSGAMFKEVGEVLAPYMEGKQQESIGKVILGTVEGDVHDIGKDLVYSMLKAGGFEVIDVGIDAAPSAFVDALKANPDAKVIALSCLLASCYDSILHTVDAVKDAGLRDKVKIIIGGGPVNETVVSYSGADACGTDAQSAVTLAKEAYVK